MSYATYITDAIVCGSKDSYSSDRSFLLFTKDAGMLWATARSVREEKSKQRYALQDFSEIRVSLVKGKTGWRIGSVDAVRNVFLNTNRRAVRGVVYQVTKLLRRFVHGEEPLPQLYADTVACFMSTTKSDISTDVLITTYTLRLLHQLGYVAPEPWSEVVLRATDFNLATRESIDLPAAKATIDTAMTSSQL